MNEAPNAEIAVLVCLTDQERKWIALTILDALAERNTDDAARLIEARTETLISRRLAPVRDLHQRVPCDCDYSTRFEEHVQCGECGQHWPCSTIEALTYRIPPEQQ